MLVYLRGKAMKDFWDEDVHNCDMLIVDYVDGEYIVRPERIGIMKEWNFLSPVDNSGKK